MSTVRSALDRFRLNPFAKHPANHFDLVSSIGGPASSMEISAAWDSIPVEAADLWAECRQARFFEDTAFGQWGLVLLEPAASAERTATERAARPTEFQLDDVVIGTFLGDSEILVIAPSESGRRRIMVGLPLDGRADWFGVAADAAEFLSAYFDAGGNKFWEASGRPPQ